jgi:hypothetical protein
MLRNAEQDLTGRRAQRFEPNEQVWPKIAFIHRLGPIANTMP